MEIRNDKTGEVLQSPLTNLGATTLFNEVYGSKDHWLWFWIHKAVHPDNLPSEQEQRSQQFLGDLFIVAIGYGLERPMIRMRYKDQRFKVYLSPKGTLCLKSGMLVENKPDGNEFYVGCWYGGKFLQAKQTAAYMNRGDRQVMRPFTSTETEFLKEIGNDPINFVAKCSKDMGRCAYCNQPLEDPTSKRVGYGRICAGRWGLPWGDERYMEKAPSISKCYNSTIAAFCNAIRLDPYEPTVWYVFADALEEAGLPRCSPPENTIVVPRT